LLGVVSAVVQRSQQLYLLALISERLLSSW